MNDVPNEKDSAAMTTTTITATTTTTKTKKAPSDEESLLSTSTASDSFEAWTLLTNKNDKQRSTSSVEVLNNETDDETATRRPYLAFASEPSRKEEPTKTELQTTVRCKAEDVELQNDDLSDGISIISDSENADRATPHSFLQDCFHDDDAWPKDLLDGSDGTAAPLLPTEMEQLQRQRRRRRHSSRKDLERTELDSGLELSYLPPFMQRGLTGMFYVAIAAALLSFIGRLSNPEWRSYDDSDKPMFEIEQKLNELELQNNLMRAEIDIMSKQVNYLSTLGDGSKRKPGQEYASSGRFPHEDMGQQPMPERKGKAFKAWPGNGNRMEPVEITKSDLKRAYQCADGQFVEVAGMCIEKRADNEKPFIDELGDAVDNVLEQSQSYRQFKRVSEKLSTLAEDPVEEAQEAPTAAPAAATCGPTATPPEHDAANHYTQAQQQQQKCYAQQQQHEQQRQKPQYGNRGKHSHEHCDNKDKDDKDSHERFKYKKHPDGSDDDSKERQKKKYVDNSKEQRYGGGDGGGGGGGGGKYGDSSKERYKRHGYNSKERYNSNNKYKNDMRHKHKNGATHSGEHSDSKSGEWHAHLMQQREEVRRQHERQRNDKNWYIKRGDSREQLRQTIEER